MQQPPHTPDYAVIVYISAAIVLLVAVLVLLPFVLLGLDLYGRRRLLAFSAAAVGEVAMTPRGDET